MSVDAKAVNGSSPSSSHDPEAAKKIDVALKRLTENFGKVIMTLMRVDRYQKLALADLTACVLEPLMRDRILVASKKVGDKGKDVGLIIWAGVSPLVDEKIRQQIKAKSFPIRLDSGDWNSGPTVWVLDVIAPNDKLATATLGAFRKRHSGAEQRLHPNISHLVSKKSLEALGFSPDKAEV